MRIKKQKGQAGWLKYICAKDGCFQTGKAPFNSRLRACKRCGSSEHIIITGLVGKVSAGDIKEMS